jgi:hypothetical protein
MFLLAQLHMDALAASITLKAVREALKTLPTGLKETYDEAMRRIESQQEHSRTLAIQVLSWMSYASRPLTRKSSDMR